MEEGFLLQNGHQPQRKVRKKHKKEGIEPTKYAFIDSPGQYPLYLSFQRTWDLIDDSEKVSKQIALSRPDGIHKMEPKEKDYVIRLYPSKNSETPYVSARLRRLPKKPKEKTRVDESALGKENLENLSQHSTTSKRTSLSNQPILSKRNK
jgi:hypothetical protein